MTGRGEENDVPEASEAVGILPTVIGDNTEARPINVRRICGKPMRPVMKTTSAVLKHHLSCANGKIHINVNDEIINFEVCIAF